MPTEADSTKATAPAKVPVPARIASHKAPLSAARLKENVIEAEIRAQQLRERELQLQHMNKNQSIQSCQKNERKKGTTSPHDSDEGFVDPPVEGNHSSLSSVGAHTPHDVVGYTHVVTGPDGDTVIYDAVSPARITR